MGTESRAEYLDLLKMQYEVFQFMRKNGAVALRNTPLVLKALEAVPDQKPSLLLLRDAFDMLEEDFEEERFFVTVRRGYWQATAVR